MGTREPRLNVVFCLAEHLRPGELYCFSIPGPIRTHLPGEILSGNVYRVEVEW
jgi:hypothetical protein